MKCSAFLFPLDVNMERNRHVNLHHRMTACQPAKQFDEPFHFLTYCDGNGLGDIHGHSRRCDGERRRRGWSAEVSAIDVNGLCCRGVSAGRYVIEYGLIWRCGYRNGGDAVDCDNDTGGSWSGGQFLGCCCNNYGYCGHDYFL
jgi:hypothetical protein